MRFMEKEEVWRDFLSTVMMDSMTWLKIGSVPTDLQLRRLVFASFDVMRCWQIFEHLEDDRGKIME